MQLDSRHRAPLSSVSFIFILDARVFACSVVRLCAVRPGPRLQPPVLASVSGAREGICCSVYASCSSEPCAALAAPVRPKSLSVLEGFAGSVYARVLSESGAAFAAPVRLNHFGARGHLLAAFTHCAHLSPAQRLQPLFDPNPFRCSRVLLAAFTPVCSLSPAQRLRPLFDPIFCVFWFAALARVRRLGPPQRAQPQTPLYCIEVCMTSAQA